MDFKYVKDYIPELQAILKEKYGVSIDRIALRQIVSFPFRNITTSMSRGHEVSVLNRFYLRIFKKGRSKNPH